MRLWVSRASDTLTRYVVDFEDRNKKNNQNKIKRQDNRGHHASRSLAYYLRAVSTLHLDVVVLRKPLWGETSQ